MAFAMGMLAFTACSEKKAAAPAEAAAPVEEVVTDSAFQAAAAGDYKSADGKRVITLNADFTAKTTNLDKDYYKWELEVKPQGTEANITLDRKGLDADVKDQLQKRSNSLLILKKQSASTSQWGHFYS